MTVQDAHPPDGHPSDERPTVIRLGQFLKYAGLVGSGGDAKVAIADGEVRVNGEVELRRRRQLKNGDLVAIGGEEMVVELPEGEVDDGGVRAGD